MGVKEYETHRAIVHLLEVSEKQMNEDTRMAMVMEAFVKRLRENELAQGLPEPLLKMLAAMTLLISMQSSEDPKIKQHIAVMERYYSKVSMEVVMSALGADTLPDLSEMKNLAETLPNKG